METTGYTFDSLMAMARDYEARAEACRQQGFDGDLDGDVDALRQVGLCLRLLAQSCLYAPGEKLPEYNDFLVGRALTGDFYQGEDASRLFPAPRGGLGSPKMRRSLDPQRRRRDAGAKG